MVDIHSLHLICYRLLLALCMHKAHGVDPGLVALKMQAPERVVLKDHVTELLHSLELKHVIRNV